MPHITFRRGRGMGQDAAFVLPEPPELQPSWVTSQPPSVITEPLRVTLPQAPAVGILGWLQENQVVVLVAAGTLLLLALTKGRR